MKRMLTVLVIVSLALGCGTSGTTTKKAYTIAFVPKLKGIPYFLACQKGAEEAGKELGLNVVYDGPTKADSNEQIAFLNDRMHSGEYNALAVACTERDRLAPTLDEAKTLGLPVVTYDADTRPESRLFHVNMATYDAVAHGMVDALLEQLGADPKGKVGILTSSLEAPNQSELAKRIKAYMKIKAPNLEVLPEVTHGEDRSVGIDRAGSMVQTHRDKGLVGIIGLTSVAVPAAAEAVRREKMAGKIKVTGVSTPRDMKDYVKDGTVESFILWSPIDLGYLTIHVCDLVRQGKMPTTGKIKAGRLGEITVTDREVLLGPPLKFTKDNIDKFDF